ncbi:phosphatase 2A regulatory subunit-related protein, putative [Plasmodium vivax]|nr:phosphatase 2A regulatory subunit-related protein, putative [Plasmodium vivax]
MKRAQFVANGKMKNEKANAHTERLTPPGLEKSEMKDSHFFPHLFLKGELMRQFLMDEDVWLFIQNFKMKLKESPNDVDSWLDYQLHLARNNMGHLFHSDIPPFEHIKKNSESFSPKVDYEGDKNYGHPNEFAKRNDFSEQCGRSTCDDLGQLDRLTRRSGEEDESGEEDKTDGERKKDEKDEKGGDRTTSLTLGTSRVGINDILMRRLSQSEQERKGSGSVHVGSSIPTQKDDPHLGESKTRAESRHSPSGTAQRRSSSVGSDLQFSSERNDHTDGLTDENPKHHHSGEDMIIKKRHAGREEAKGGTNSYSGEDEECHEIMGRVQQPRERNHLGDEIFSPQRKAVMKSRYEVSTTPTQCSEKDDMMITFGETTLREDGTHWKGDDDYVPDGAAKGAVLQEGTPLGEDKPGDRSGRRLSGGKQRPGGSTSPVEEPLQGEVHNKAAPKKVPTKQVATNEVPTNEVPTNQGSETQHRAAAPIASKTPTEESPLPKKNKALEGSPHEEKQSGSDPTYNPSSGSKFPDKNKREVPIVIPKMTVTIDKLMNEETDRKLKKIFCQCDNKMDVDSFERLVVIDFLKIGRYMSHTLFSRIEKANEDFVTCEEVRKYFRNRFIDGTKDPSYYDDRRYRSSFERGKQGSLKSALHVATPLNGGVDEESANAISNLQNGATHIHCEEGAPQGDDGGGSQKGELTDVPYKKCSVINFFNAIKDQSRDYIEFKDFDVFVREILKRNTSLQFLHEHVEFLERYIESVIVRIYYHIDVNDTNRVYLKDLRKHNLAHIWCCLDDHIKVQHVKNYFSYSHFYVYYCTFCQTSSCKDMLIDDNDLYRFDNHSLNDFIVNRIWSRISIKLGGPNEKYMCLNDWIYFIMNYEDMTSNRAIEFWFKLIDLDADCVIRDHEIQVFFNIQMERLKSHYLEEPKFEDWLCQMNDAIQPKNEGNFTLSDFKRNKKYAARFFGCLVSLSKLLAWESRDVYKELQIETEFPHATPWEIFCKTKYDELCYMENEGCYEDNFDSYDAKAFYGLDSD